jgi:hypothetical protein
MAVFEFEDIHRSSVFVAGREAAAALVSMSAPTAATAHLIRRSLSLSLFPPSFRQTLLQQPSGTGTVTFVAFPTDKGQCKDGGWQAFGVFKNQGDCVSFVETGGKNPPTG